MLASKAQTGQEIIYRDGDPLGNVYVVLNGSVVIHRALEDAGGPGQGACLTHSHILASHRMLAPGFEDTAGPLSLAALMVAPLGMVGTLLESSVSAPQVWWVSFAAVFS